MFKQFIFQLRIGAIAFDTFTYILLFFLFIYVMEPEQLGTNRLIFTIPCLFFAAFLFTLNIHFVKDFGQIISDKK